MNTKNYLDPDFRNKAIEMHKSIRKDFFRLAALEPNNLYADATMTFLCRNALETMFVLPKDHYGVLSQSLQYDFQLMWPTHTLYSYCLDVLTKNPSLCQSLCSGYAVKEGKLIKSTFYVFQQNVDYQSFPQSLVLDPLAVQSGIVPDFYFGYAVAKKEYIERAFNSKFKQEPLDLAVLHFYKN